MRQEYHDRIERLRLKALDPVIDHTRFHIDFFRHFTGATSETFVSRFAKAVDYAYDRLVPVIDDEELIVGKFSPAAASAAEVAEMESLRKGLDDVVFSQGQDAHMTVDYNLLLTQGIEGVLERIAGLKAKTEDPQKLEYYDCCCACLRAVIRLADRYSAHAFALAETCTDPARKAELNRLGEICARVPRYPAASFHEAIQSVHFMTLCISMGPLKMSCMQFQLGRPDRYLYPFFRADMEKGVLTEEYAQLLLDCLAIMINHRVKMGLSSGWMVGGRDRHGNIVANELTRMGMQVVDDVRLVYPAVGLCYTEGMPEEYLHLACEILSHGRSHPAIFNDDIISAGLREYGVSEEECHDYIQSTCVEITPVAASNIWVASPYTNLPQKLLDVMDREYGSFDELVNAYFSHLSEGIKARFEEQNELRRRRSLGHLHPLQSCFVNDCLERGTDIERGGARYNWIMPSFVGMANTVDALYIIKTVIFDRKEMTMAQYKAILDANFEGHEDLRLRLLNTIPKYGNDVDAVDQYAVRIIDFLVSECRKHTPMFTGARLVPSVFCWEKHARFGSETGATPDGRLAGFPLGDGSGPCQGREMCGPTASILSSTKWSHKELIGGVAVNMKFSKKVFVQDSLTKMMALIRTYLLRGGFEIQVNITDYETLKKAQEFPEQYRDLLVRIGGYSDYFVRLSPEMQAEVMLRTAHEL